MEEIHGAILFVIPFIGLSTKRQQPPRNKIVTSNRRTPLLSSLDFPVAVTRSVTKSGSFGPLAAPIFCIIDKQFSSFVVRD